MPETSLPAPRTPDPQRAPTVRWGVLAPGGIAGRFVESLTLHTRQRVVAVASRTAERARAFAERFDVRTAYGAYADLVADPEVDVVYVASPHSEHAGHALLAIAAGKHVLVEKAFTRNAREAQSVVDAARERGVFLMEAMWTRFLPHMDVVAQVLASGALGEVQTVIADHGQPMVPHAASRLFAPELAGGALLDLGVYPVSFAALVLGEFDSVTAVGTPAFTGVDAQTSVIVTNGAGAHGLVSTTLNARTPATATISGTLARLELAGRFYAPTTVRLVRHDGEVLDSYTPRDLTGGLRYEAAEVARCIDAGLMESTLMRHAETVQVMLALDEIRRQVGVRFPGE